MTDTHTTPESIVDTILDELGTDIVVGTPLGIGKANRILNELVERALDDPEISLSIWTALTLSKPEPGSELEGRLLDPIVERLFGSYPNLRYAELLDEEALPENIEVHQFYFPPGRHMDNPTAQQAHHSVNYTHALRAFREAEPNLLLQLIGSGEYDGERHYNIASNTDLSRDLIASMRAARQGGDRETMIVGELTEDMPFMYGDAPIQTDRFDAVLNDDTDIDLFGPPNEAVSYADQAIGLRVSTLLKDGGTLQIGIGALGDAIGWATQLRHTDNDTYREILDDLGRSPDEADCIDSLGGLEPFDEGLYGSTEMFVQAFLELFEAGVLSREVYEDPTIQSLADEGIFSDGITIETLDRLLAEGAISAELDAEDVAYLKRWGIFADDVSYEGGALQIAGESVPANLGTSQARGLIAEHALGDSLSGGRVLHGGFFMGSQQFYEGLREMAPDRRRKLAMTSVQFTNALYGDQQLKRRQRRHARFANTGMKATVTGGVASDGTADGRVVSGVGGQFNFVNQAHELDDGRSIIMIRAVRDSSGEPESNIVWNYGHITIPRHLRDIVVTEYGIADLRGKSDAEVIAEMITVADSRFQDDLVAQAKDAGKLPADWEVPEHARNNYSDRIESALAPYREQGVLPRFPYGSDLTAEEQDLARALRGLEAKMGDGLPDLSARSVGKALLTPSGAAPYLDRMGLASPSTRTEFLHKRLVTLALAEEGVI
jgi:acyl-CoA hydrolase